MKGLPQMEETAKKPGGKREGQKYKSLLVWDSARDGSVCSAV